MAGSRAIDWLKRALNAALALDPEIKNRLAPMEGRVICIRIKLLERNLFVFPSEHGLELSDSFDGEADTTLTGTPLALLKMGLSKQVTPMLLKGDVSIEGDSQLGREFKKVLASIDIDWEEYVARAIGDAPAHQLFKTLHAIRHWGARSAGSVMQDASEYVQEESRDVISAAELEQFYRQVDELRDATARLEKDIQKLKPGTAA